MVLTLTADACFTPVGTSWTLSGPYASGTVLDLEIEAPRLVFPPGLRVSGSYPAWRIDFEDGGDDDFDDLTLEVRAMQ